jgi:phospholipase C
MIGNGNAARQGLCAWEVRMADIQHVVVLMLENRSFDSMLGRLYPNRHDFDGLKGDESNEWGNKTFSVWASGEMTPESACLPNPDPNELFADMTEQIFGSGLQPPSPPAMSGFVSNYMKTLTNDPLAVMHGFTPEQVPVISQLAMSFGVSDRWHASVPSQTWPNRFFVHTGTAGGYVNNSPVRFPYLMQTIFNRLSQRQKSWRIYFHDVPLTATLSAILSELPEHLYSFEDAFMSDAMMGRLPNYSFIEPRYFPSLVLHRMPNDQHPPHNVAYGERLIARCYDALRNGAGWERTLFIVTYDEHGGTYDHVPPPDAVSPDDASPDGFRFDRYGVRVPAVVISPWIPAGSIVRPPAGSKYPFDHASVLSTLRKLFDLGKPLTRRDAAAPDLLPALSLPSPSNPGPASLAFPSIAPSEEEIASAHKSAPNDLQRSIIHLASKLPAGSAALAAHAELLSAASDDIAAQCATAGDAIRQVEAGLSRFLKAPRLSTFGV